MNAFLRNVEARLLVEHEEALTQRALAPRSRYVDRCDCGNPLREDNERGTCADCHRVETIRGKRSLRPSRLVRAEVLEWIAGYRLGVTTTQVAEHFETRYDTTHSWLCRAVKSGDLVRLEVGVYGVAK